jgi:hypothetical protein
MQRLPTESNIHSTLQKKRGNQFQPNSYNTVIKKPYFFLKNGFLGRKFLEPSLLGMVIPLK